ncbi:histidine phosphatase family protein [Pseudoruegeria sp. SK021]|uniref:histidine phosphatase family protein n=1 Tax=Pseudoruegeria sp. SK021 TaxID=1933035 RepID=UPI000A26376C|nr:histidine phosphatase family protein [Pseudoruegeria sp. SK021]OSP56064.1 hypothetical protein BV911_03770 [Pseudoruegeria sp. SK021]
MSPLKTFWWVRHGPTHAKTMTGWTDRSADLSDHARLDRLHQSLPATAPVVSSDLIRAQRTADALGDGRQRLPDLPDLREMHFGDWEDKSFADINAADPDRCFAFFDSPGALRAPGGESWDDLSNRVDRAVAGLLALPGPDVIIVAHMGVILTRIAQALSVPATTAIGHQIAPLSVTRTEWSTAWTVPLINHSP